MFSDSTSLRNLSFDSISFARASRKAFGACPFLAALRGSRRATDVIFSSHEVREVLVGGRWGQGVGIPIAWKMVGCDNDNVPRRGEGTLLRRDG